MIFRVPSQLAFHSRQVFHSYQREKTENIDLWMLRIKHSIASCEYEKLTEFMLIDKFLSGLNNEDFKMFSQHASWTEELLWTFVTENKLQVPNNGEYVNSINDYISFQDVVKEEHINVMIFHFIYNKTMKSQ